MTYERLDSLTNEELIIYYREEEDDYKKELIKNKFFEKNKVYPYFIAQKYKHKNIPIEDLAGTASVGMMIAFNKFDPTFGNKFITFATVIMHHQVIKSFRKYDPIFNADSLNELMFSGSDDKEITGMEMLESDYSLEDSAEDSILFSKIKEVAKDILTEKEHLVMMDFMNETPKIQLELGEDIGVSQVQVSRLRTNAINKIRNYFNETPIKTPRKGLTNSMNETVQKITVIPPEEIPSNKISETIIPGGTKRQKIEYLDEKYPHLSNKEIADKVDSTPGSVHQTRMRIRKDKENAETAKTAKKPVVKQASSDEPVIVFKDRPSDSVESSVSSPKHISLALDGASAESIQFMLKSIASTLQGNESYSLRIEILMQSKGDAHSEDGNQVV